MPNNRKHTLAYFAANPVSGRSYVLYRENEP